MESNKALNNILLPESLKLGRSGKENYHNKKVTDCEIIESTTVKKSNNFFKKKIKCKVNNDKNVSDSQILEMNIQELKNNRRIELAKELNQHRKKHKHESLREMKDLPNCEIKESDKTENIRTLDELYKRKRHHKQREFDNMSDCLSNNVNGIEISQNTLNNAIVSDAHKQKLVTTENLLKTANIELNHISNNSLCCEGAEKGNTENSDNQNISKLSRKNYRHSEFKAENLQKKKYKSTNDLNEFDCKIDEPAVSTKSNNNVNSKKKKKHKVADDENASESKITETIMQELENDINIKFVKSLRKQKRKKVEHKLLDEMENVLNHQASAIDESEKNRIRNVLEIHRKENKHKQSEISDYKTAESNADQNDFNRENLNGFHAKKKKKHKHKLLDERENTFHFEITESNSIKINQNDLNRENINKFHVKKKKKRKLFDEMENTSDCETVDLNLVRVSQDDLNSEKFNKFHKKKKKEHKNKLLDEIKITSDCETADSNRIEINQSNLNSKNINEFHEKKKKKHNLFYEIKNTSDCETVDLNLVKANQDDLNSENFNKFHKKKKKKHKNKLLDEIKIASDCETADSNPIEINQSNLNIENINKFHEKKKKKHNLFYEIKNTSDCETVDLNLVKASQDDLNSENLNKFHKKKKKKHKNKLLDEIKIASDCETVDSNPIEINKSDLNKFHKKKHGHKLYNVREIICNDNFQESTSIEAGKNKNIDTLQVPKRNKYKSSDVNKIYDNKIIDSGAIEINHMDLSNESLNQFHKSKKKKLPQNLAEIENMPKIVTESNDTSNNNIYHEYIKVRTFKNNSKKSIVQNSVVDKHPRTNKKNKDHVKNRIELLSDNLQEKEKDVVCKESVVNYREDACMSFDPFIHDMTSAPVSFPVPLLHESETVSSITPEKITYLEKNGVTIHTGKWTKTEDDILIRNFQQFGLEFKVNNPFQLLGINQNRKDNEIEKFKRAKHFLIRLGKDLNNRTLRSIYMRARKLLTPLKTKVKLSAEETIDLKHAHQLVGNKWTRISDMLSRSDSTCHTAFRWHKSDINKGKWTPDEESNLIKAIKTVSGTEDISANNLKNISWKAVAKYVSTRNEFQCHKQWAEHLAWDTSVSEKKCWQKYHYGKLIYLLKEKYHFNSDQEIDWRELHKHFNDVAPSYIFLHKKWLYLKGRLPKGFNLSYIECLNAFQKRYEEEYKICANEKLLIC
ncbi:unnamed protein product [Larinioides sclopetarius]|uniref:Uncharacterized protein n=1 Tax=Larinioides sclopetarius TaxID=280406 RepID=A0AAV2B9R8_9ARAC